MTDSKVLKVSEIKNIKELAGMRHSRNINNVHDAKLTFGERLADKMADFAGSWIFIISFGVILLIWIIFNSIEFLYHPFDPYPYILLNLVLSCLAALQAPVIMMSQNRQETKDRIRAEHDYEINLKAEILIEEVINRLGKLEEGQNALMQKQQEILASKIQK